MMLIKVPIDVDNGSLHFKQLICANWLSDYDNMNSPLLCRVLSFWYRPWPVN